LLQKFLLHVEPLLWVTGYTGHPCVHLWERDAIQFVLPAPAANHLHRGELGSIPVQQGRDNLGPLDLLRSANQSVPRRDFLLGSLGELLRSPRGVLVADVEDRQCLAVLVIGIRAERIDRVFLLPSRKDKTQVLPKPAQVQHPGTSSF